MTERVRMEPEVTALGVLVPLDGSPLVAPEPIDRFLPILPNRVAEAEAIARALRDRMVGRVWWNINSTAHGGGVAEMCCPS